MKNHADKSVCHPRFDRRNPSHMASLVVAEAIKWGGESRGVHNPIGVVALISVAIESAAYIV